LVTGYAPVGYVTMLRNVAVVVVNGFRRLFRGDPAARQVE